MDFHEIYNASQTCCFNSDEVCNFLKGHFFFTAV